MEQGVGPTWLLTDALTKAHQNNFYLFPDWIGGCGGGAWVKGGRRVMMASLSSPVPVVRSSKRQKTREVSWLL